MSRLSRLFRSRAVRVPAALFLAATACSVASTSATAVAAAPPPSDADAHEQALRMARELGNNSYFDADKAPQSRPTSGLLAAAADFPTTPPQPDTNDCLVQREARRTAGWTYNRLLWCQEIEHETKYGKLDQSGKWVYKGSIWIRWEMVALGSNTQRSIRVFWRPVPATVRYVNWTATEDPSQQFFGVQPKCRDTDLCTTDQVEDRTTWERWNTTTRWTWWDVHAPAYPGDATREKLTRPSWHLVTNSKSEAFPVPSGEGKTLDLPLRCDSADYFSIFGRPHDQACVFTNVVPHIQYNLSSPKHGAVARHIQDARLSPETC
ncbi:hypothetical protein [Nonomuraea sp. NPDC003201]